MAWHVHESREGYEFDGETKYLIRKRQHEKCAVEGCNKRIEDIHHILPIAVAKKYFPHVLPELIASIHNGVGLCKDHHKKEHKKSHDYGEISRALIEMGKRERV